MHSCKIVDGYLTIDASLVKETAEEAIKALRKKRVEADANYIKQHMDEENKKREWINKWFGWIVQLPPLDIFQAKQHLENEIANGSFSKQLKHFNYPNSLGDATLSRAEGLLRAAKDAMEGVRIERTILVAVEDWVLIKHYHSVA